MCGMLNFSPTTLALTYYKTIDKPITSVMKYSQSERVWTSKEII
jgi:hypothetical protein